jgi:putative aldouronate transport system permease protein
MAQTVRPRRRRRPSDRPSWQGEPSLALRAVKGVVLAVIVTIVLAPFLVVISTSLATPEEVIAKGGWVVWPDRVTFAAYEQVLSGGVVTRATTISLFVTVVGTFLSLLCTVTLAYALARPGVFGGKPVLLLVLFTFLFPPGIIPSYLVVQNVGLLNSYFALILPVLVNAFNLVVMRGFFQGIPDELYEAARIDGAGDLRILVRIVLPLSKAVVAVVGLFYAVSYWNSFFNAILYLNDSSKWPIQAVLQQYVTQGAQLADASVAEAATRNAPHSIQMAVVVLALIPIVCVYPFIQRHFVKGVMTGAIKG